jgi:hypothetical protein
VIGPLLLAAVIGAAAASPLPDAAFADKVDRLMRWISDHSDLEVPDRQPAFLVLSIETINYTLAGSLYAGETTAAAAFARTGAGVVSLPIEGYSDDVLQLVHFMQMTNDRNPDCAASLEREAYTLQARFTEETGIGKPINPVTLLIATACPHPWKQR